MSLILLRYITTGGLDDEEKLPVGVFVKRKHMVQLTLQQLIEMKRVASPEPATNTRSRVVLHMKFNQGL